MLYVNQCEFVPTASQQHRIRDCRAIGCHICVMSGLNFPHLALAVVEMQFLLNSADIIIHETCIETPEQCRAARLLSVHLNASMTVDLKHSPTLLFILEQHTYLAGIVQALIDYDTKHNIKHGTVWVQSIIYPLTQTLQILNRIKTTHGAKYTCKMTNA